MPPLGFTALRDALVSEVQELGYVDRVLEWDPAGAASKSFEPINDPGYGLTAAVWVQDVTPYPDMSGMNTTSARVLFMVKFYRFVTPPLDVMDPDLINVCDDLMDKLNGNFTLDGQVAFVDLLGAAGVPVGVTAGFDDEDENVYRVTQMTVPLVVADVYTQTATG